MSRSLRPCAYWARDLKDCETRSSAYAREALVIVEVYLVYGECKRSTRFSVVTEHVTLTHLLKQPSDNLADRQVYRVERLMPFAQNMSILHRYRVGNEADLVSRRPDFFHRDGV